MRRKLRSTGRRESEYMMMRGQDGTQEYKPGHDCVGWLTRWEPMSLAGWIQGLQAAWLTDWVSDPQACLWIWWQAAWRADWLTGLSRSVKVGWLSLRMASWLCIHYSFSVSDDVGQAQF